jgi:hypothetical protein
VTKFEVHFTVHEIFTTFAEVVEADEVDHAAFRKILNERLVAEGFRKEHTVNEIFFITER